MPDITMCDHNSCKKRFECYRHEGSGTQPNQWRQSYFMWADDFKPEECKEFWPNK